MHRIPPVSYQNKTDLKLPQFEWLSIFEYIFEKSTIRKANFCNLSGKELIRTISHEMSMIKNHIICLKCTCTNIQKHNDNKNCMGEFCANFIGN